MSEERMEFGGGKYTVINDNGRLSALRNGEPWGRDLVGDNLIYWMLVDALRVSQKRDALAAELCAGRVLHSSDLHGARVEWVGYNFVGA